MPPPNPGPQKPIVEEEAELERKQEECAAMVVTHQDGEWSGGGDCAEGKSTSMANELPCNES